MQDQIASQGGTNKAYPHNFAGIIATIEELVFTQKEVPGTPADKRTGGRGGRDAEESPEGEEEVQPGAGERRRDQRTGQIVRALESERQE